MNRLSLAGVPIADMLEQTKKLDEKNEATDPLDEGDRNTDALLPRRGRRKKEAKEIDGGDTALFERFVNLTDFLPPIPKKGDFDVETIKGSQYFFS